MTNKEQLDWNGITLLEHLISKLEKMYKISVCHPTCRPEMARVTREKWLDLSKIQIQLNI